VADAGKGIIEPKFERLSSLPQIQGKLSRRYSELCAGTADAEDVVRSAILEGFAF
jgi:hypothetical protein